MQTGLYPHRNGSMGFFPIKPEVRTLNQQLHDAGYLISMFGKNNHHQPAEKFCVDVAEDKISRHPSQLAEATRKFLKMAREQGRPFFHNVNCYDPHRPFIGINGPDDLAGGEPPSRWIKPEEVTSVPGFLEDLPEIRRELAGYYTNVRRLDDAVGAVLAVLKEEGFADNTLVMFYGGDHGMSFPFAKVQRLREQFARRADHPLARRDQARQRGPRPPRLDARLRAHAAGGRAACRRCPASTAVRSCPR